MTDLRLPHRIFRVEGQVGLGGAPSRHRGPKPPSIQPKHGLRFLKKQSKVDTKSTFETRSVPLPPALCHTARSQEPLSARACRARAPTSLLTAPPPSPPMPRRATRPHISSPATRLVLWRAVALIVAHHQHAHVQRSAALLRVPRALLRRERQRRARLALLPRRAVRLVQACVDMPAARRGREAREPRDARRTRGRQRGRAPTDPAAVTARMVCGSEAKEQIVGPPAPPGSRKRANDLRLRHHNSPRAAAAGGEGRAPFGVEVVGDAPPPPPPPLAPTHSKQ